MSNRATCLRVDQVRFLDHWCRNVHEMFEGGACVYLVGSVLTSDKYRDVDIRVVVSDYVYEHLGMAVADLNMLLSRWGQDQTHLPIDCQVQSFTESNTHSGFRNPRPRKPTGAPVTGESE